MTPTPLHLPVRAADAVALARVVFDIATGRAFRDDVRGRIAARLAAERFAALVPHPASLACDPVHADAYFIAVDGTSPVLLRLGLASAPASALFPNPTLITRSQSGAREFVISAIPLGPADSAELETFAHRVDPSFLPKPSATAPFVRVAPADAAAQLPPAFQAWRKLARDCGLKGAAVNCSQPGVFDAALWCAIRSGWRDGWQASGVSRRIARPEEVTAPVPPADLELLCDHASDAAAAVEALKQRGIAPQGVSIGLASEAEAVELLGVLKPHHASLVLRLTGVEQADLVERVARSGAGHVSCEVPLPAGAPVFDTVYELGRALA